MRRQVSAEQTQNLLEKGRSPDMTLSRRTEGLLFAGSLLAVLMLHLAFAFWYGSQWVEWDTAAHTRFINAVLVEGTLVPSVAYPAGFAYAEFGAFFTHVTSLPVILAQLFFLPALLGFSIFLVSYALFRRIVGRPWGLLAAILLNAQADFLFTTSRGSHEKLTLMLVLMSTWAIFMLIVPRASNSEIKSRRNQISVWISITYIALLTLIFTNMFFAWVFVLGLFIAFLVIWRTVSRAHRRFLSAFQRLPVVFLVGFGITYLFAFVYYLPARGLQITLSAVLQTLLDLFGARENPSLPYSPSAEQWRSVYVWVGINVLTWVLLAASAFVTIATVTGKWFKGQVVPRFLVSLEIGLGVETAASTLLDSYNPAGIHNIGLRTFPIALIPVAALAALLFKQIYHDRKRLRALVILMVFVLLFSGSVGSLLRATADPSVSLQTRSYFIAERDGIGWIVAHRDGSVNIWAGNDDRLYQLYVLHYGYPPSSEIRFWVHEETQPITFVLLSPITGSQPLQAVNILDRCVSCSRVYDTGGTTISYVG